MPSSMFPFEVALVPDLILQAATTDCTIHPNLRGSQRTSKPTQLEEIHHALGGHLWLGNEFRESLKALPVLVTLAVHFQGYLAENRGTAIIRVYRVYWADTYPRIDFTHPQRMRQMGAPYNFWGGFALALAPLDEFQDFCVADPDGSEFLKLCHDRTG